MRYTVVWLPSAEEELANIWNGAADRQAVSRAANEIEILLRTSSQARAEMAKEHTHSPSSLWQSSSRFPRMIAK
jgi:plasmid stabilization system protein ParE